MNKDENERVQSVDLSHYRLLLKDNKIVLENLITMTIESFIGYKEDFQKLIKLRDPRQTGLLAHKLKMTSTLLKANRLEDAIKEARALLEDASVNEERLNAAVDKINIEFDRCIMDLQNSLNNL